MISYEEAKVILLERVTPMPDETCGLSQASGRVLRQRVCADRDFPPYDRVMMDGYALRASDLALSEMFRVADVAPAGAAMVVLPGQTFQCIEVMTGAVMPHGADLIVPVEMTAKLGDGMVRIDSRHPFSVGQHLHRKGSDAKEGDVLLESGRVLGAREIGIAASCGLPVLTTARLPRIAIQPTGDELVHVEDAPLPHQIRQSNGYALAAGLARCGYHAEVLPVMRDDVSDDAFATIIDSYDFLIVTGAVSKGARDFVPKMLDNAGCECLFHGVAQRPGKPLGTWLGNHGCMILALPGNPVSAMTGLFAMVIPAIEKSLGKIREPLARVHLDAVYRTPPGLTVHLPVKRLAGNRVMASAGANSGDFIGLIQSDGWITVPADSAMQQDYEFHSWL